MEVDHLGSLRDVYSELLDREITPGSQPLAGPSFTTTQTQRTNATGSELVTSSPSQSSVVSLNPIYQTTSVNPCTGAFKFYSLHL
jgi:hypothetical protein